MGFNFIPSGPSIQSLQGGDYPFRPTPICEPIPTPAATTYVVTFGSGVCFGDGHTFGQVIHAGSGDFPFIDSPLIPGKTSGGTYVFTRSKVRNDSPGPGDYSYRR